MEDLIQATTAAMARRGFTVLEAEDREQARDIAMELLAGADSVGIGGSVTIQELELIPRLRQRGVTLWSHTGAKPEEKETIRKKAMEADAYLCSANAVTRDGRLLLVDGTGNRAAAICFGPKQIIMVISHSKVVDGGTDMALARVKTTAAPLNAKRLNLDTPCARGEACGGTSCAHSICNLSLWVEHPPAGRKLTVIFTQEKMGY